MVRFTLPQNMYEDEWLPITRTLRETNSELVLLENILLTFHLRPRDIAVGRGSGGGRGDGVCEGRRLWGWRRRRRRARSRRSWIPLAVPCSSLPCLWNTTAGLLTIRHLPTLVLKGENPSMASLYQRYSVLTGAPSRF